MKWIGQRKIFWIVFGIGSLLLKIFGANHPEFIEKFYSRGVFYGFRTIFDALFSWSPIPLIYLVVLIFALYVLDSIKYLIRSRDGWKTKLLASMTSIIAFVFGGIGLFFWLWGYNYGRIPIETHLNIDPKPLSFEEIREELNIETEYIKATRAQIPGITDSAFTQDLLPPDYESKVRQSLQQWLVKHHYPTPGHVRGRELYPNGIFLRFSSSGLYFPFSGEGHVDAGVHPLQKPSIIGHELSHGYGFGDEGTCSFTGYLACVTSSDPVIRYSGHLNYWRILAANYIRYDSDAYFEFRKTLPAGIINDLNAINENLEKYPDIMPRFRYYAYDAYLKSQGIKEGMLNYNRVVMLLYAERRTLDVER